MLAKNTEYTVKIEEIGCNGEGVARIEGCAVFVPYALKGETVKIKILKAKDSYAFAKLAEVITPSSDRIEPKCSAFQKCGGCNLQHVKYAKQLEWKAESVKDCFYKIADMQIDVPAAVASPGHPECYRYRNKLQLPIRNTQKGNVIGFFREGTHDVIPIDDCQIQQLWAKDIIQILHKYIKDKNVSCYNEVTNKGVLKHVVVRDAGGSLIITVVITQSKLPFVNYLIGLLSECFKSFSLYVNVNKLNNNVVLGEEFKLICGEGFSVIEEQGIKHEIGPRSFMQVNNGIKDVIYADVCRLAGECDTIIDAYSGAGFLTALLAKRSGVCYGIECVQEAVDSADKLAEINGLGHKMFNVCANCEDALPPLIEQLKGDGADVTVVLDPPRKGCDRKVVQALLRARPKKIIYVSCNPSTLARDVGMLCGTLTLTDGEIKKSGTVGDYRVTYIQPYDMFPQTKNVEMLVCLEREG